MANNQQIAEQVLAAVGGKANVSSVTHCMTRLRFVLVDESKAADDKTLEAIAGVLKVIRAGGQVQVVIGRNVDKVYANGSAWSMQHSLLPKQSSRRKNKS